MSVQRPSCPGCFGILLHASGRTAADVRPELNQYGSIVWRTPRGRELPEQFLDNVMCGSCPLKLSIASFRRVWSKADRPRHLDTGRP